jgi:hypothetical protein
MANKSAMPITATRLGPLLAFGFFKASQFIIVVLREKLCYCRSFRTAYLEYFGNTLGWSRNYD